MGSTILARETTSSPHAMFVLAALCLAVALGALWWASNVSGGGGRAGEGSSQGVDSAGAEPEEEPVSDQPAEGGTLELPDVAGAVEGILSAPASGSSAETFLDDLAKPEQGETSASVIWTEEGNLIDPISEVLAAYEAAGTYELETYGYLDIMGNQWGAVLRDERGWVDIAYVTTTEEADETTLRVVRLFADP